MIELHREHLLLYRLKTPQLKKLIPLIIKQYIV